MTRSVDLRKWNQMLQIYCDHNFLIAIRDTDDFYLERLIGLVDAKRLRFVLSLWSLVEIARISDESRRVELAAIADHIRPGWLPERRHLHAHEIGAEFFTAMQIPHERPATIRSLKEVAAETCETVIPVGQEFSAVQFVSLIRDNRSPIESTILQNQKEWNSDPWPQGEAEIDKYLRPAVAAYIAELIPHTTPAGLAIAPQLQADFLPRMAFQRFPSIVVETALIRESRKSGLQRNASSFMDFQYGVVALPYTDVFVTDDQKLRSLIERCRPHFQFVIAKVMSKAEFEREFLP
jgi:hypothetical protein